MKKKLIPLAIFGLITMTMAEAGGSGRMPMETPGFLENSNMLAAGQLLTSTPLDQDRILAEANYPDTLTWTDQLKMTRVAGLPEEGLIAMGTETGGMIVPEEVSCNACHMRPSTPALTLSVG